MPVAARWVTSISSFIPRAHGLLFFGSGQGLSGLDGHENQNFGASATQLLGKLFAVNQVQAYPALSSFTTRNLLQDRPSETCAQPRPYLLNRQTAQPDPLPIGHLWTINPGRAEHGSIVAL